MGSVRGVFEKSTIFGTHEALCSRFGTQLSVCSSGTQPVCSMCSGTHIFVCSKLKKILEHTFSCVSKLKKNLKQKFFCDSK